uniref:Glycoprotein A33 n=1 Tax=Oryzias latipes TaxID=8090 RepID=A0A3P9M3C8_ORYLA
MQTFSIKTNNSTGHRTSNHCGDFTLDLQQLGTSTLRLTGVTMKDSRHYQCSVKISGDDEGTTAASTSVLPPSPPICRIQGKVEYYQDINLTCMSEEGSPKPVYTWTTFSVENIPRQFPPKTTQKDGVLSLYNISRETSGYFICTSKNSIAVASCNVTLAVVPGSMNIGATAGIIGGVLAGLLVVGILIFCMCKRKNKKGKYAQRYVAFFFFTYDKDDQHNHYRGSREHLDDQRDHYGSRDRLDDRRENYGSRDHLDNRQRYGSRDNLDDQRGRYGGSRDRLDDRTERYGSRDRLDDRSERHGSRDRLDDRSARCGSRDRLDDRSERHGSRDRLDDHSDQYQGSDRGDHYSDRHYRD